MNDLILGDNAHLPAHLQQYAAEAAEAAASMVSSFTTAPKLSLRGKQFRIAKEGGEVAYPMGQPLDVIILATDPAKGLAKSFFKTAYSSGSDGMPDCFSSDGITPDAFVETPVSRSCAECPKNAFGSGIDQQGNPTKGKGCADNKLLFLVEASDVNGQILMLRVPPTSLKSLSAYGRKLNDHGIFPAVMVTQLTMTDSEYPRIEFNPASYLDEETAAIAVARSKSSELKQFLPSENIIKAEPVGIAAPQEVAALPAPPAAPAPQEVMTAKAEGAPKESFTANGWTDAQLIEHGYMELK